MADKTCVILLLKIVLIHVCLYGISEGGTPSWKYAFSVANSQYSLRSLDMYVSATENTIISIEGPGHTVPIQQTLPPGSTHVSLQAYIYSGSTVNGVHNSSVTITSDKEVYIHVTFNYGVTYYSEAFLLLPITEKSTEYLVAAYSGRHDDLTVSSISNNNNIHIDLNTTGQYVAFAGHSYYTGTIDVMLNEHNTAYIEYRSDLIASHITSSKPASVEVYNYCASIHSYSCGSIAEQYLPVAFWKHRFIFGMFNTMTQYTIRILSSKDNNRVKIANENIVLNEGQIYEKHINQDIAIAVDADMPVLVLQYSEGYDRARGGASMLTVPAVDQFLPGYTFTVPPGYVTNHVTISIESRFVSGLQHNGVALTGTLARQTTLGDQDAIAYSVVRFAVTEGVHRLSHVQQGVTFGAVLYGFRFDGGYGFPLGLAFGPICSPYCENGGVCVSDNVCRCSPGFHGQYCQQGSAVDQHLKPELHSVIPGYSLTDPLAWYQQPDFTDNNKVCYVKVNVKNGDADLVVSATSNTQGGSLYGNFTTAPIDSTASFQGSDRFACLEVRCPFATINGTAQNTVVRVAIQGSNQTCSVSQHTHSLHNFTVVPRQTSSDEIEFILETGRNYGPYYGIYYSLGTLGKAKYLAEHKCNSGHEYDYDSFNTDVGVIAQFVC